MLTTGGGQVPKKAKLPDDYTLEPLEPDEATDLIFETVSVNEGAMM
jgi:hypothetical protein